MKLYLVLMLLCAAGTTAFAAGSTIHSGPADDKRYPKPPMAKVISNVTEKHGVKLTDNYCWLRDKNNPEVMKYLKAENAYTRHIMKDTEQLQEQLYQEMKSRIKENDVTVPRKLGNYLYFSKTEANKQYSIHYRQIADKSKPEEIILDENELAKGKDFCDVGSIAVSSGDNIMAYAVDYDGDEKYTVHFVDLNKHKQLSDTIPEATVDLEWAEDNKTIFYVLMSETQRPYKIMRHELGTDCSKDVLVYEEKDEQFCVSIEKSRDDKYMFVTTGSSTSTEVYYFDAKKPSEEPKLFAKRQKDVEYFITYQKPYFYIMTNENATNFKVMRTSEEQIAKENWEEFIAHDEDVLIEGLDEFENYLVISQRKLGLQEIKYINIHTGKTEFIPFTEAVYSLALAHNPEYNTNKLRYLYYSLTTPECVIDYDMETGMAECLKRTEVVGNFDPNNYTSERCFATAEDGTRIPISLVYRKDMWGYGPCSMYLTSYGAYGISTDPYFSSVYLSLLDRGYIYAIAHIRGGQELGRKWYENGKMLNKKNTFTDFIACAEHLIEQGYTRPEYLAIEGGSAGGLLMGAVTNMRPDLFRVVIADVPFVDMMNTMLDPTLPLTIEEYEEWGNPDNKEYFDYMLSYSPYDNVEAKAYPNMLFTAGLNDPRVSYWEPAKMVAKLRAMKTDNNFLMLKTNMGQGHMGASGRYDYLKEIAFNYAFIFKVLGTYY